MRLKLILALAVLLLSANVCAAQAIESQTTRYSVVDKSVFVETVFNFTEEHSGMITWSVAPDADLIEVYLDSAKTEAEAQGGTLAINTASTRKVKVSYITNELIDKSNFLLNIPIEYDTGFMKIILVLPEGATLKNPISDMAGSVYPKPGKSGTDGKSLIFIWERNDLKQGDEISIFAMYEEKANYIPIIAILAVLLIILAYLYYTKHKPEKHTPKPAEKRIEKEHEKELDILEHLKEDEKQIIRVLKQREGSCEQGTLRIVTGFSKAHLSRLLSELEARKVVHKEKRGKKNLVFLK
jgi:uncharacterized membrane protein